MDYLKKLILSSRNWYSFSKMFEDLLPLKTIDKIQDSEYYNLLKYLNEQEHYLSQLKSIVIFPLSNLPAEEIILNKNNIYSLSIDIHNIYFYNLFFK